MTKRATTRLAAVSSDGISVRRWDEPTPELPDGPATPAAVQSLLFHRDPLGYLRANRQRYGDIFTLRMAIVGQTVVIAAPRAAQQVVLADPGEAHAGEGRRHVLGMVSPRSVLGADDEQHQVARQRVAEFFTPETLDPKREAMAGIAGHYASRWPRLLPFRLLPRIRTITNAITVRLVLGVRDPRRGAALAAALQRMLWTPGNPPVPPPAQQVDSLVGRLGAALFERRSQPVVDLLTEEIDIRRTSAEQDGQDVIGLMLRADPPMSTSDMIDEIIPLLMAGQEPPAVALTWLFDRLGREPELADHLAAAPEDEFSDAVVKETLRLHPPVHSVLRKLTQPMRVGEYYLPAGTVCQIPMILLHRDPEVFPGPDVFRPDRFRFGATSESPAYLPFGGGSRQCLGVALAQAQIGSVIPAVLHQVRLHPVWPQPERMVVRGTVLVPHRSALIVAQGR